jgi:hypothetical protein
VQQLAKNGLHYANLLAFFLALTKR